MPDKTIMFSVIGLVAWAIIGLPTVHALQADQILPDHAPEWTIAIFTAVLAFSTIALWFVTWRAAVRQSRELKVIERAHLSAIPLGINPYIGSPNLVAHVGFHNAGSLPARNARRSASLCNRARCPWTARLAQEAEANRYGLAEQTCPHRAAGIEFQNGDEPGVRLRKKRVTRTKPTDSWHQKKSPGSERSQGVPVNKHGGGGQGALTSG